MFCVIAVEVMVVELSVVRSVQVDGLKVLVKPLSDVISVDSGITGPIPVVKAATSIAVIRPAKRERIRGTTMAVRDLPPAVVITVVCSKGNV